MNINKKVLASIFLIQIIFIILIFYYSNLNLYLNLLLIGFVAIAGGKIYSSICDFEGKLHKNN